MYKFDYVLQGIPCQIEVEFYQKPCEMKITGSGFGDATPPDDEEFEFRVLSADGQHSAVLEELVNPEETKLILKHYKDQFTKR